MQRPAKPWTPVQIRPQPPIISSPGGEIGRRKGLNKFEHLEWKHLV
ncbi:protein of unknown function [Candidatus Nitrosacidococcus tergens]|uniref:Uncharacterized protein n=1 Tax=Candidatus Nitrosacidococcus tergens TaxID=553981 RepID=A0A7G1Q9H6_9GAMM|nr:protein of unknown function [Candidatus Nitrosacidococcus tergens]